MASEAARPVSQTKLPAGLAGVLNGPEEHRDSAYYSSADIASKHNSAASGAGLAGLSPTSNGYHRSSSQTDKTPSPTSTNLLPQPLLSPTTSNMSVASMVSPASPNGISRQATRPLSLESGPHSAGLGVAEYEAVSRRESVDSRMNQGFNDLRLSGNSPYASHNQSTTSIHNTLAQHRNPRAGLETLSTHRISNGYQPHNDRNPLIDPFPRVARTAPTITGPAQSQIARAAEPTKGQAWAFPEEEIQRVPSHGSLSFNDSRRSSIADSVASSQFTTESRLPPGQRRLDESLHDYPTTHHHALQHRQVDDLRDDMANGLPGAQPYSRTPELRVSHKLAERKRRTEMKELFENLRDLMPQERGSKASKWEILTKAINEYRIQNEKLVDQNNSIQRLSQHCHSLQQENEFLKQELAAQRSDPRHMPGMAAQSAPHLVPPMGDMYARGAPPRPELPPLRSLSGGMPAGAAPLAPGPPGAPLAVGPDSAMTGVQYEQPRINGAAFRQPEPARF